MLWEYSTGTLRVLWARPHVAARERSGGRSPAARTGVLEYSGGAGVRGRAHFVSAWRMRVVSPFRGEPIKG